jgi:hypothetical protein
LGARAWGIGGAVLGVGVSLLVGHLRSLEERPSSVHQVAYAARAELDQPFRKLRIGTACSSNGLDYVAYFRHLRLPFPGFGALNYAGARLWVPHEGRLRFSLETKGPPMFALFANGARAPMLRALEAGPSLAWRSAAAKSRREGSALVGVGRLDYCQALYYEESMFADGALRLTSIGDESLVAEGRIVAWTGQSEGDPLTSSVQLEFLLEPLTPLDELPVFQTGGDKSRYGNRYRAYERLLQQLTASNVMTVTLSQLSEGGEKLRQSARAANRRLIMMRHDVDLTLFGALELAELEHAHGVRGTYYINPSSGLYAVVGPQGRYLPNPSALADLLRIQDLGHEVAFHNDTLMLALHFGVPFRGWLEMALARLRSAGLRIRSESENGSHLGSRIQVLNRYTFHEYRLGGSRFRDYGKQWLNGREGVVRYRWRGRDRVFRIPNVSREEVGLEFSAAWGPLTLSDTTPSFLADPDGVLRTHLRTQDPDMVTEILTHPSSWTVLDLKHDVVVDRAFDHLRAP